MRHLTIALLLATACAVDVSSTEQSSTAHYCGTPPVTCYPGWNGLDNCDVECRADDEDGGWCPPYSTYEIAYCTTHYNLTGMCQGYNPIMRHYCIPGAQP